MHTADPLSHIVSHIHAPKPATAPFQSVRRARQRATADVAMGSAKGSGGRTNAVLPETAAEELSDGPALLGPTQR